MFGLGKNNRNQGPGGPPQPQRGPQPGGGHPGYKAPANQLRSQRGAPGYSPPPKVLTIANSPNAAIALANQLAVNPSDFEDNQYVIVDNTFIFTTAVERSVAPGTVGASGLQRRWAAWSLNQPISFQVFDIFQGNSKNPYLSTVNVEIRFKNKNRAVNTKFDQDILGKQFNFNFGNQILVPTELLAFEFQGIVFEITVKSVQMADLSLANAGALLSDIHSRGILIEQTTVNFFPGADGLVKLKASNTKMRSDGIIKPDFKFEDMGIGGLDEEFSAIFRRAFASRTFPPGIIEKLGVHHVKGILLHGPPGTGKTLIARQIGKMLNAREPKIVNGPEILSKYVGSSEENIRNLFKDAEAEYKAKGEESGLHIIIFDELDSVFKQRGSRGDGTGVGDNVVNQLLAKMDGVDQLNNILVIGMTNRRDLIDDALLRPGRFEMQIEISLPDEHGRFQILEIQTKKMRESNMVEKDVDLKELATLTKNFSGAEIEGLVRSATSFSINRHIKVGQTIAIDNVEKLKVIREDFMHGLTEVIPAFGVKEEELEQCAEGGIIHFSPHVDEILSSGRKYIQTVQQREKVHLTTILMHGPAGSGKTALAAKIALESKFPFIRLISPIATASFSESQKIAFIDNTFRDAYKSPLNVLVIDDIESMIDWSPVGPRYSNNIFQTLKAYLKAKPPNGRRLVIIATTSQLSVLRQLSFDTCFDSKIPIPNVTTFRDLANVLKEADFLGDEERARIIYRLQQYTSEHREQNSMEMNVGIKTILHNIEVAEIEEDIQGKEDDIVERMTQAIADGSYI